MDCSLGTDFNGSGSRAITITKNKYPEKRRKWLVGLVLSFDLLPV